MIWRRKIQEWHKARVMNLLKRFYNMLMKNSLKRPLYLTLFVTNRCNSRCQHCFNWRNEKDWQNELTLQEIEGIAKQIGPVEGAGVSGGEPMLREDIDRIDDIFIEHCKITEFGIPTNCLMPRLIFEKSKKMLLKHPDVGLTIHMSLDGIGAAHDKFRGVKGNFEKFLETYELLKELKKYPNFSLKVDTTITNKNINEIEKIARHVRESMPEVDFHSFEIVRGDTRNSDVKPPSVGGLRKLKPVLFGVAKTSDFYRKNKIASLFATAAKEYIYDTYLKTLEEKKAQVPCYVGRTHCIIDSHGNVYFCELTNAIGNLRENSFEEIWNSKKAKEMREFIGSGKCYCVHSCFMQNNILFTPRTYPAMIWYFLKRLLRGAPAA